MCITLVIQILENPKFLYIFRYLLFHFLIIFLKSEKWIIIILIKINVLLNIRFYYQEIRLLLIYKICAQN